MPQPRIVGLIGASGAGKTEVAKTLVEQGYTFLPMSCVLKDMLRALGLSEEDLNGSQEHRLIPQERLGGMSPRAVAQSLGTQWARQTVHPDLLVRAVCNRLQSELDAGKNIVLDGMRFPNEWAMVRSLGGVIWRVRRPYAEPKRTILDRLLHMCGLHPRIHESEYHWPDAMGATDFHNVTTREALQQAVREELKRISQ